MTNRSTEYSRSFCDPNSAKAYEQFYRVGTSDEAIWSIERDFLREFFARNKSNWPQCSYLDFACGTGRVIAFMEQWPTTSRGIDISQEMLDIAKSKVTRSELLCADITMDALGEGSYDLITAFRFFLNAEPDLRQKVMNALARRLKNEHSRLVFTNHGNPYSYKALAWPLHRIRQLLVGRRPAGNYLTHRQVKRLVADANLQIVERIGCGLVSPKIFNVAPSLARTVERRFGRSRLAYAIGVDQIYVVGRRQ